MSNAKANASDRLRIGIVGCGRVTQSMHLPALARLPDAEVTALAEPDDEKLAAAADAFGVSARFSDHHDLLAGAPLDAVAVCVPPTAHARIALDALAAGRHVYLEKPVTLDLDEASDLLEAETRADRRVALGFNYRSHRLVLRAREALQQGALGPVELVRTVLRGDVRRHESMPGWRDDPAEGGSVFCELGSHHFDLVRYLLDTEILDVHARVKRDSGPATSAVVSMLLQSGAVATTVLSETTGAEHTLEIHGVEGTLHLSCYRFDGFRIRSSREPSWAMKSRMTDLAGAAALLPAGFLRARTGGDFLDSYVEHWRNFLDAIRDEAPLRCSLGDGCAALRAVLAAAESGRTGLTVEPGAARRNLSEALGVHGAPTREGPSE